LFYFKFCHIWSSFLIYQLQQQVFSNQAKDSSGLFFFFNQFSLSSEQELAMLHFCQDLSLLCESRDVIDYEIASFTYLGSFSLIFRGPGER